MDDGTLSRRGLLARAGTAAVAATSTSGTALAQSSPYDGYLSETSNYDGTTVDRTGADEVTITVGAQGNGGPNAFDPPAVAVDPGTTVRWEWTGNGFHNVVAEDDSFRSGNAVQEDTFERTVEQAGVIKYYCAPHRSLGMNGVVAVGDTVQGELVEPDGGDGSGTGGSEGGSETGGGEGEATAATELALGTLLAMLALGFLSPIVFFLVVRRRLRGPQPPG